MTYAGIPPQRRQALHRRLAGVVDDPEERGRHLALAAEGPDAGVAAALDEAVARATARGAPDAAADLLERASRLTPPELAPEARGRRIRAAERHFEAGDIERARALLEDVVDESPPSRERA